MKAALLVATLSAAGAAATADGSTATDYAALFAQFRSANLKAYASEAEEATRFANFVANMKTAEAQKASNPLADFGVGPFADMSAGEFAKAYMGGAEYFRRAMLTTERAPAAFAPAAALASSKKAAASNGQWAFASTTNARVDWREKGAVTPVRHQGSCGSCWAYSTAGNIEGLWAAAGNPLAAVSIQQLTSCVSENHGCNGGLMDKAFEWIITKRRGEVVTEEAYPYEAGNGRNPPCRPDSEVDKMPVAATIGGYYAIQKSEDAIADVVLSAGPVAAAVDATSFQMYRGGVITNCVSSQINHGILVVGFDTQHVPPYWVIKNSWGTMWGDNGYVRIAKGSNQCLINSFAVTATLKK